MAIHQNWYVKHHIFENDHYYDALLGKGNWVNNSMSYVLSHNYNGITIDQLHLLLLKTPVPLVGFATTHCYHNFM